MLQLDPATGAVVLPIWMSAAIAAGVLVLAVLAVARSGVARTVATLAVVGALGYAGWLAFVMAGRVGSGGGDRAEQRRVFDARVNELTGRAMLPGSPLSCIDGAAGDQVASGCEKLIFSGPDTIAAAVSYVAARLAMMSEAAELAAASGLSYDNSLNTLRRGLESDRYGIVAYLLLQRPTCKPEHCDDLALLREPGKVRVNLLEKPFDVLVARYSANWQFGGHGADVRGSSPVAGVAPLQGPAVSGMGTPLASKYDFPSASSIPAVSIMNAEPAAPPPAAPKPAAAAPKPAPAPNGHAAPAANRAAPARAAVPRPKPQEGAAEGPRSLAPAAVARPASQ